MRALPAVRTWMSSIRAEYLPQSLPVAALAFPGLPGYFSDAVLQSARVVTVTKIPFPPILDLGLIEFADMSRMALSGVTYDDLIFVHRSLHTERIHFHELVHFVQWRTLGVDRFLLTYGLGVIERGYAHSPLEALAYDLQSQFDRGVPLPDLESLIAGHAQDTAGVYDPYFAAKKE